MASVTSAQFPSPCQWIQSVTMADDEVVIGLNDRAKLYINGSLVSQECNSFAVHAEFFLFTTLSHQLKSCSLAKTLEDNIQILSNKKKYDDSHREVEQGSIIVAVVPTDTRLVLQMPRGNLEVIEPRVLMVSKLRKLINEYAYWHYLTQMQYSHCVVPFTESATTSRSL
jgi:elongator complex protein 1